MNPPTLYRLDGALYRAEPPTLGRRTHAECTRCAFGSDGQRDGNSAARNHGCRRWPCFELGAHARRIPDGLPVPAGVPITRL